MVARGRLRQWQAFRADMESAPTVSPWPPLRGGSARSRWGRELYGCPKYFGLWQSSLPPPLRGTSLAEGGQYVKKHLLCLVENVGATIGRPPAWRSNALFEKLLTRRTGTGEQCSPLQEFFDRLTSLAEGGFISSKVM